MSHSLQLRSVHLRVADLSRSVAFYVDQLGLVSLTSRPEQVELAVAESAKSVLTLTQDATAPAQKRDAAGLFHAAMLLESRAALGHWLRTSAEAGVNFDGFSDHGVSEAIYLTDPDGNGLEFYADRPRDHWPIRDGELQMGTDPLAIPELLAAGSDHRGPPLVSARWGHLHLRVSDLDRSEAFYTEQLKMQRMQRFGSSARFLAADGYHHHLGLNNWGGVHQPRNATTIGLIEATFARADISQPRLVTDPDGIALRLIALKET
ncbi:MAG TPA: VOC family protein [Gemmatimonadaceae bacterium]|nr:VOC family protein [Gemmatimonadaceae bacterium]